MKKILYIGNYLSKKRHNPTYMYSLGQAFINAGYEVKYSSSQQNKVLRFLDMVHTVIVNRQWVDIVLIDTYSTLNFYYALVISQLCRLIKKPYICILHGGNLPKRLKNNPKFSSFIFKNSKYNIAPSEYLREKFKAAGYINVVLIPNAINLEDYSFLNRPFDEPRLLWVRSFSKIYNPQMAVKVLAILKINGYNAQLCMVGPIGDKSFLKTRELAKKLNVEVKFTGKLSKTEWLDLSRYYNIFINTSNFDNAPISVIEAMALGLPIVSTNVGGMPYLIESNENGMLVNPRNSQKMANAIEELFLNMNLRNRIISKASIKAEQFDWNIVKEKWNNILRD